MTCPFAYLASKFPNVTAANSTYHKKHPVMPESTLSLALRRGTATSHRNVERSKGVGLLLSSIGSSATKQGQEHIQFDRKDYVRWMVMLGCIYVAMEAGLKKASDLIASTQATSSSTSNVSLLDPLIKIDILRKLARVPTILRDIDAHLSTLNSHNGVKLDDIVEETIDTYGVTSSDRSGNGIYAKLASKVLPIQDDALALDPSVPTSLKASLKMSKQHISILSPSEARATFSYVDRLGQLSDSSQDIGLLLSHAYTRYLGDLSGGQHIVRKVSKRWPCDEENQQAPPSSSGDGFQFYHFDEQERTSHDNQPGTGREEEGKTKVIRIRAKVIEKIVSEANKAFDLNSELFESLLPESERMDHHQQQQPLPPPTTVTATSTMEKGKRAAEPMRSAKIAAASAGQQGLEQAFQSFTVLSSLFVASLCMAGLFLLLSRSGPEGP
ncbi:heme oxygenase-like protein [Violaceomyces palustris]|uniref:Heme oxygenase-like protein n=1 Tax=Violaceomyces palustris TaxID=1673888 RepID=A0ACD0P3T5_9BASI|nr:heme oxygenase-like protein [Violaceomyces palustris]